METLKPKAKIWKCPICHKTIVSHRGNICDECFSQKEKVAEYKKRLESNRLYLKGEPIPTLYKLLKQKVVFVLGRTRTIEFVKCQQIQVVLDLIKEKEIFYAVRKEK